MSIALRKPIGQNLNLIATQRASDAIALTGRALPASVVKVTGTIVTVKFEVNSIFTLHQVRMPLAGSEYFRAPIQVGCKGAVFPVDAYLGGMSGLGGGVADLAQRGNLSTLIFFPIGNTGFQAVDGNVATIYGPSGVTLQDQAGASWFKMTPTSITMQAGGHQIVISSAGVVIDGKPFLPHTHTGVQTGGGTTGPVA